MKAKDIMTTPVVTVSPATTVREIAALLLERRISAVPVVEDGRLVGLVSEGDLLHRHEIGTDRDRPARSWWLGLIARKALYTLVPTGPSYALHSTRYRFATTLSYLMIVPFAWLGLRRLLGTEFAPTALFLLASSAVLVALVFFPQERFRVPVIDPTLIICAAASGLSALRRAAPDSIGILAPFESRLLKH